MSTPITIAGFPVDRQYTPNGIWVKISDGIATVGLSPEFFEEDEIYYIELPKLGAIIAGDEVGLIETTKSTIDIESPITGTVVEINEDIESEPEDISQAPYEHWLFRVKLASGAIPNRAVASLLSAADFVKQLNSIVA